MDAPLQKVLVACATALLLAIGSTVWSTSNNVTALSKDVEYVTKQLAQAYGANDAQKDLQMRDFRIDALKDTVASLSAEITGLESQLTALGSQLKLAETLMQARPAPVEPPATH